MPDTWGNGKRSRLLHDWCSSHNRLDPESIDGQIRFLDYELKTVMHKLGSKLADAKTVEDAAIAIEPYWICCAVKALREK
jgi:hypothetical protein